MRNEAIWEPFTPYKSAGFVQRLLKKLYEAKGLDEPLTKSYQNGSTFSYYIEHGQKFFSKRSVPRTRSNRFYYFTERPSF
ncbi:YaaC family protein [Caenibacillus caldisaponilyticus]|uniref:YaaC family protein n=1 Tax=Caenibacillus caldisaponilyticus TaxID=1674942 RepID=UPI0013019B83